MTNSDSATDTGGDGEIETVATEYLESLDQAVDDEELDKKEEEIEYAEERRERLKAEHGEDHRLVQRVSTIIENLEEERDGIQNTSEAIEERRRGLLEAVVNDPVFTFDEQWLSPCVIKAVTHSLYGTKDDRFAVHNREIQQPDDLSDVGELERIDMEHVVVSLARDRLDSSETVEEQWERLADSNGFPAFEVLAEHGPMTSTEAADEIGEESGTVNNWFKNPINFWDEFILLC